MHDGTRDMWWDTRQVWRLMAHLSDTHTDSCRMLQSEPSRDRQMPFSQLERCCTPARIHKKIHTHTHMHTHSVLCSSPSILHLSAPCCQRARQEVMFVPSGTVIFSFSPLLTHVSFLLLFSPLLSFPLHFCVAFTVKKNATGLEIQPVRDRSGLWSGLYICESVCGESPGMNMTRALCQRGYSSNCLNANDHIWMHCYLAFLSHSYSSSVAHPAGRDSFSKLFQPLNGCWRSVKERQVGKGGVKRG